ncbi:hypothetical protein ACGH2B_12180 [Streptomyces sp. BBFR2]
MRARTAAPPPARLRTARPHEVPLGEPLPPIAPEAHPQVPRIE